MLTLVKTETVKNPDGSEWRWVHVIGAQAANALVKKQTKGRARDVRIIANANGLTGCYARTDAVGFLLISKKALIEEEEKKVAQEAKRRADDKARSQRRKKQMEAEEARSSLPGRVAIFCDGGCGRKVVLRKSKVSPAQYYLCNSRESGRACEDKLPPRHEGMMRYVTMNAAAHFWGYTDRIADQEDKEAVMRAKAFLALGLAKINAQLPNKLTLV